MSPLGFFADPWLRWKPASLCSPFHYRRNGTSTLGGRTRWGVSRLCGFPAAVAFVDSMQPFSGAPALQRFSPFVSCLTLRNWKKNPRFASSFFFLSLNFGWAFDEFFNPENVTSPQLQVLKRSQPGGLSLRMDTYLPCLQHQKCRTAVFLVRYTVVLGVTKLLKVREIPLTDDGKRCEKN